MLQVTVVRSLWYRGHGPTKSKLLRSEDGKMCCLGFACLAAGVPKELIKGRSMPNELGDNKPAILDGLGKGIDTSRIAFILAGTNDVHLDSLVMHTCHVVTDEADREAEITQLGKEAGIEFSFID